MIKNRVDVRGEVAEDYRALRQRLLSRQQHVLLTTRCRCSVDNSDRDEDDSNGFGGEHLENNAACLEKLKGKETRGRIAPG